MRTQSKDKQTAQSAGKRGQLILGFSFVSDWLRKWREFSGPITERSKAKPHQSRLTFITHLTIAPTVKFTCIITHRNIDFSLDFNNF